MNDVELLRDALAHAARSLGAPSDVAPIVERPRDPSFGDWTTNLALTLAKPLGKKPRDIATALIAALDLNALHVAAAEIAGPGFINLRLRDNWLGRQLAAAAGDKRLGIEPVAEPRKYLVDYSAPNVAKPMHVGHIRSTVIGDALYRTLKFLGHSVVGDNHLGDWGTQFGMIIYGFKLGFEKHPELFPSAPSASTLEHLGELGTIYQKVYKLTKENPAVRDMVLNETAMLHAGNRMSINLWENIRKRCLVGIDEIYGRLGMTFDETLGESFYHRELSGVVRELLDRGIARQSEGAVGVFFDDDPKATPLLVQKQDGAFLYATTDLATIKYRIERWHPDAILYVVDHRQSLHFGQLFKTAKRWLGLDGVELTHVSFGTVLGDDGKPFKTRSGDTVGLESLLDEAVNRALSIVTANDDAKPDGPELSAEQRQRVAEAVGIGAIKYADLSQNRTSDYVFSYDKMLAMNGNTATYMQYAHARVRSIFARGEGRGNRGEGIGEERQTIALAHPAERALGLELLQFAEALDNVVSDYRPNHLTNYLFALANRYSTFYEECPVLKAETPELKRNRLALCDLTARTLRQGLNLLGIEVVEKM